MTKDEFFIDIDFCDSQYHSLEMILQFFDNDEDKAKVWFEIPNPLLGNLKPWVLLLTRPEKLEKAIIQMIEGNA